MQRDMQRQGQHGKDQKYDPPDLRKRLELTQHPGTEHGTDHRLDRGQEHRGYPGIWRLENAEEAREEQCRSKEIPEFAVEFAHGLARQRSSVVRTRGVARLDKAHDATGQGIQDEHEHAAEKELPNLW